MKVDQITLISILGTTEPTLRSWRREGLPDLGKDGRQLKFETSEVLLWLYGEKPSLARSRRNNEPEEPEAGYLDAEQMRARKDAAHAEKLEMENDERRGVLVEGQEVKEAWGRIAFTIKSQLLGLPDTLCDELESIIENLLEAGEKTVDLTEIREVLRKGIQGGLEALKNED